MWHSILICVFMALSVNAFSKYGRTCKDIGCLNSEVCVLAEDPCTYGRTSDCGTYPTCKKKTAAGSDTHNVPVTKATTPKPIADLKPQPPKHDDIPDYPPPAPPRGSSYGGGSNPYGGGSNPYGGGSNAYGGGGNPYGGGSNAYGGGGNPYGGASNPYGGGSNPYGGGSNPYGGVGGGGSNTGGGASNPFGNFNFGSIFGGGSGTTGNKDGGAGGGSNPFGTIFSNILSNFTKNLPNLPSLNPGLTRPGLTENRNYNSNPYGNPSGGGAYQNSGGYYPSYNQPSNTQGQSSQPNGYVAKNYGQSPANTYSYKNGATTKAPSILSQIFGFSVICMVLQIFSKAVV